MAITHTFKGGQDTYGYGYFAYIEDRQLVIGEDWPHEGGVLYRGTYEGATGYFDELKRKAPDLYDDIEEYFTRHDPSELVEYHAAGDLKPGDKFTYDEVTYLLIDFMPEVRFASKILVGQIYAMNLATEQYCFISKDWVGELAK